MDRIVVNFTHYHHFISVAVHCSVLLLSRNVNGMTYHGVAKEKEEAASQYEVLQQQGENVGLVESRYSHRGTEQVHHWVCRK